MHGFFFKCLLTTDLHHEFLICFHFLSFIFVISNAIYPCFKVYLNTCSYHRAHKAYLTVTKIAGCGAALLYIYHFFIFDSDRGELQMNNLFVTSVLITDKWVFHCKETECLFHTNLILCRLHYKMPNKICLVCR